MVSLISLVGREAALTDLERVLGVERRSVCVRGSAGVGKTALCEQLALQLEQTMPSVLIRATRASQSIALAALVPVIPEMPAGEAESAQMLGFAESRLRAKADSRGLVLVVDDAHFLDRATSVVLEQLARECGVVLLASCRADGALPDWLGQLVQADLVEDYRLDALSKRDLDTLASQMLGGEIDSTIGDELWHLTAGNPSRSIHLIDAARQAGILDNEDGCWSLRQPLVAGDLLSELLDELLDSRTPNERGVLELVAVNTRVPLRFLEQREDADALESLESVGLLAVLPDNNRLEVSFSDHLLERHIETTLTVTRSRRLQRCFVEWLEGSGLRRDGDELEVTTRQLGCGRPAHPGLIARAARQALALADPARAARICSSMSGSDRTIEIDLLLAESQFRDGRIDAAHTTLVDAASRGETESDCASAVIARAQFTVRSQGDTREAVELVTSAAAASIDGCAGEMFVSELARLELVGGNPGTAVALASAPSTPEPASPGGSLNAVRAAAHLLRGHYELAVELGGVRLVGTSYQISEQTTTELASVAHVEALVNQGRLDEARSILDESAAALAHEPDPRSSAVIDLLLGGVLTMAGDMRAATVAIDRGIARLDDRIDADLVARAYAQRAVCHGFSARPAKVSADLRALDAVRTRADHWVFVAAARARAWQEALRGRTQSAAALLDETATDLAERECDSAAVSLWHDMVRLGHPHVAVDRLLTCAGHGADPLTQTYVLHAQALSAGSGDDLDRVVERYETMGVHLLGAEAAMQASGLHLSHKDSGASHRSRLRSDVLRRECPGARTPALQHIKAVLTARQKQVATLAPLHTNSEIATRLSISVRTVENHLSAVFATLDIHDRSKLAPIFLSADQSDERQRLYQE